ncbi:WbqC family protein [Marivirga sp.]|uniref:WbqC family protein n=1 Tax=Marivirga sp. TaxID=2018662 RepID=UPI0025EE39C8|nr:WbqC family protein [Marivirga sp.]
MENIKEKTLVIMQPTYIPWLGYFDLIRQADYFVFYDDVQFVRQSWQSRNKIKSPQGELYLSVPVKKTTHHDDLLIKDVMIDNNQNWSKKHLKSIVQNYKKAAFFEEYSGLIESIYSQQFDKLADLNIYLIELVAKSLNINTKFIRSSELNIHKGQKEEGIIDIANHLELNHYLSPKGAFDYLNNEKAENAFNEHDIKVSFQEFIPQEYPQLKEPFIPYLGVFDALLNIGAEATLGNIKESSLDNRSYEGMRGVR